MKEAPIAERWEQDILQINIKDILKIHRNTLQMRHKVNLTIKIQIKPPQSS